MSMIHEIHVVEVRHRLIQLGTSADVTMGDALEMALEGDGVVMEDSATRTKVLSHDVGDEEDGAAVSWYVGEVFGDDTDWFGLEPAS